MRQLRLGWTGKEKVALGRRRGIAEKSDAIAEQSDAIAEQSEATAEKRREE
jgi:hypothetical protein